MYPKLSAREFSPEEKRRAAMRPEVEGISIAQVARELGVNVTTLATWRHHLGIPKRPPGCPPKYPENRSYSLVLHYNTGHWGIVETLTETVVRQETRQVAMALSKDLAQQIADGLTARALQA